MGLIHVLDTETSNKIAAGEVVERPASVIKELVENSIDAGSDNITVEIRNGGVTYMRVSDNGCGMSAEDAKICFLRHATSKVKCGGDLDAIRTLGFRGEALSSIGAVAKVSLFTKRRDDSIGICVTCRGGEILSSEEAGIPDGTSIIAEDLFFNTPARLKFLKKYATEANYIADIMTRFIFAHPEISFKLIVNGKEKLFSPGDSSLKNAVYTAYGKDYAKAMLEVDYTDNGIHVSGLTGKGTLTRPNRNYQSFFVNRRYIKSPLIIRAVEDAYKNQIMVGKFPTVVLNIELDPSLMDINVHPTKLEVKFAHEQQVRNAVYYAVKNALYALPNVPEIERVNELTGEVSFKTETKPEAKADTVKDSRFASAVKQAELPFYFDSAAAAPVTVSSAQSSAEDERKAAASAHSKPKKFADLPSFKNNFTAAKPKPVPVVAADLSDDAIIEMGLAKVAGADTAASAVPAAPVPSAVSDSPVAEDKPVELTPVAESVASEQPVQELIDNVFVDEYFKIVGQVFDTYIIAEKDDKMLIIDQHAAHERLKYEALLISLEKRQIFSQILLEPVIVKLSPNELSVFELIRDRLDEMGLDCDVFGDNEVIIRGVPGELDAGDAEDLLLDLISTAASSKQELITAKQERMLYTIACKAAIKANHSLTELEMESLVRDVLRLKNINTCPHGRPIVITMSKKEIEKEFKRIV